MTTSAAWLCSLALLATGTGSSVSMNEARTGPDLRVSIGMDDSYYCVLMVHWVPAPPGPPPGQWVIDACTSPCAPPEGGCAKFDQVSGGARWVWCECDSGQPGASSCQGAVRNPGNDPTMPPPFVNCQTNECTDVFDSCDAFHLLDLPEIPTPICVCQ
jgi:hypothetical protein